MRIGASKKDNLVINIVTVRIVSRDVQVVVNYLSVVRGKENRERKKERKKEESKKKEREKEKKERSVPHIDLIASDMHVSISKNIFPFLLYPRTFHKGERGGGWFIMLGNNKIKIPIMTNK